MPIKHFGVLQSVLSQTCDVICQQGNLSRAQAFEKAESFIRDNSERWRLPDPGIKYEDPFCRMAYLYMNVAIHAVLVERALETFSPIKQMIREKIAKGDELKVCALGGGPGSELLGLTRFIENFGFTNGTSSIDFILVDRIKEWDESWHSLKQGVDEQLRSQYGTSKNRWPVIISRSFLPLDVTSPKDFRDFAVRSTMLIYLYVAT